MTMRVVLVGAVDSTVVALETLVRSGRAPVGVVTLPPELASRHSDYRDIAALAKEEGARVVLASNVNAEASLAQIRSLAPDIAVVVGWSQLCGHEFRQASRLGALGFHPSALPRMRGRAVIPWTILCGEKETASTLFWLDEGTDSGDIAAQSSFAVDVQETAGSLYARHLENLARMLPDVMAEIESGRSARRPQDHAKATYCAKRAPEDGAIDWTQSSESILRLIRAVGEPYPGAFTLFNGSKVVVWKAEGIAEPDRFIGLPGQVQAHVDGGFVVCCGDGRSVLVRSWKGSALPRIHAKFDVGRP